LFELISDLKINFHKNDIYCLGDASGRERATLKEALPVNLAMKYLGVPINTYVCTLYTIWQQTSFLLEFWTFFELI
jgi:hypothetical protein